MIMGETGGGDRSGGDADTRLRRRRVNVFSFGVTCCALLVAVAVADGELATRISEISVNLDRRLHDVMDSGRNITYTEISQDFPDMDEVTFRARGMAGLYNLTNAFMDLVVPKNVSFDGLVVVENQKIRLGNVAEKWKELLLKYIGLLVMCVVVLLIGVCMPFCGFCFCCCRCCGNCGARSQPSDKKHDLCKKIILATMLICLGTVLLFVVVCAFASNQQLHDGVNDLPGTTNDLVHDVKSFMDFTGNQLVTLLRINYGEFAKNFLDTINNSSEIVYEQLTLFTDAVVMTNIINFAARLEEVKLGFKQIKYSSNNLRYYASQLNIATRKVKKDLLNALKLCPGTAYKAKCDDIMKNISTLGTNIDFNNFPDITEQLAELQNHEEDIDNLHHTIETGNNALLQVETKIQTSLNYTLEQVKRKVTETNNTISDNLRSVTKTIEQSKQDIDKARPYLQDFDRFMRDYGKYQYYVGLGISCLLLLISLCIMLGLICGICGKRPDVYGDDCCNKGAGSQFLICGVMLMFTCGFLFAVVVLPLFLVGLTSQRLVCEPVRSPDNSGVIGMLDAALHTAKHDTALANLTVRSLLNDIAKNRSLYQTFGLVEHFNLSRLYSYMEEYNKTLGNMQYKLSGASQYVQQIQLDKSIEPLQKIQSLNVDSVDFDKFEEELSGSFTTVNLTTLSEELGELIDQIKDAPDLQLELQASRLDIDNYQEKLVLPMTKNATDLIKLCRDMKKDLTYGNDSFQSEVDHLIKNLRGAQENLKHGQDFLINITRDFANNMSSKVETYIDRVVHKTKWEIGKTGPLAKTVNNTLAATCDKIILPFNGFWFVMFCSLLVFIPTIIVSVKLATLYQKYSPYSGHLVETEYLYDAYTERDNIPLNSRSKHRKKKNKKTKHYEDRSLPTGAGDMVSREYAGGSHQDARYADMAPKHWEDFPAGGPPQYQRAPTEYERPPPYYYPGTGDNQ